MDPDTAPDAARALLDAMPMPAVLIGAGETVTAANAAAEAMFGPGMTGRHYITVLRQPALLDCVEAALRTGQGAQARFPTRDAGRDVTFRAHARPVAAAGPQGGGQAGGILLCLEDVSHVEEASQMRRDFVANVSHELRSPLTALSGFIETLRGPARDDPAAQERFLEIMEREAARMSRLIQDLLSLSRVEAAERVRPTEPVDMAALVDAVVAALAPLAEERGVTLQVERAGSGSMAVPGDADQLSQVLTNLIENAVKYGGDRVVVTLEPVEREPSVRGPAMRISVTDNGAGIDPVHVPRLTERFYRVDSHRSREMGGTGLGLAIVKHIVNRHRGRLRIDSAPGKGSRFTVILPRQAG